MDLALNNLQKLICHKTQQTKPNQTKPKIIHPNPVCSVISVTHRYTYIKETTSNLTRDAFIIIRKHTHTND